MDEDKISPKFANKIQENFNRLRNNGQLLDFDIIVDGKTFKTHKCLLAASSDYFRNMFSHDSQEAQENRVVLEDFNAQAIEAILDFCYTAKIKLTKDNVQDILFAANRIAIDDIQDLCVDYIRPKVNKDNCLGVLTVADTCHLPDLVQETLGYCLDKFEAIIEEDEFHTLDATILENIISHDQLNIDDEEKLFQAIVRWFKEDSGARGKNLESILRHVRFSLIPPLRLIQLSDDPFFQEFPIFHKFICEAKDYLLLKDSLQQLTLEDKLQKLSIFAQVKFRPRTSLRRQQRIFAVGGWTNDYKPIRNVERYDPYLDEWSEVSSMTKQRCGVGLTILGDSLYAIGGHDGTSYLSSGERYDILSDTWFEDVADMTQERTSVGVVALDGFIYAIGGQLGSSALAEVERYNPLTNEWEACSPLGHRRLGAGVTILNGYIYVIGGAEDKVVFDTVERYDPKTLRWTQVTPMTTKRKHLGCASSGGKIYAVGGRGEHNELNTAECYDPERDCWDPIPSMSEKRSGVGLVELDGLLFAVGGHNGDRRLELVETYDPQIGKWSVRSPMIFERLGGGLAVYSKMKVF